MPLSTRQPRLLLAILTGLLFASGVQAQEPARDSVDLIITDVTVVDVAGGRLLGDLDVEIDGGRIVDLHKARPDRRAPARRRLDGTGRYLVPGLWDMHVHALDTEAQATNAFSLFLAHGVTGIRDMGSHLPLARQREIAADVEAGRRPGPRVVSSGTLIDGPPGAWPGVRIAATYGEGRTRVAEAASEGWTVVKAYALLGPDAYRGVAEAADSLGLALVGHVPESIRVREAIAAGQHSIEHLGGKLLDACSPGEADMTARRAARLREVATSGDVAAFIAELRTQADEAVETFDAALCTELAADLAATDTYVAPTLVVADFYTGRDPDPEDLRLRTVPPDVLEAWAGTDVRREGLTDADRARSREAEAHGAILLRALRDARVPILASTDAGWVNPYLFYGASLHDELERYQAAGLSPAEALQTATLLPARFLGREDELGTIRRGHLADLVLLDADPLADVSAVRRVWAVITGGRLYDRTALDALLDGQDTSAETVQASGHP